MMRLLLILKRLAVSLLALAVFGGWLACVWRCAETSHELLEAGSIASIPDDAPPASWTPLLDHCSVKIEARLESHRSKHSVRTPVTLSALYIPNREMRQAPRVSSIVLPFKQENSPPLERLCVLQI
jgi:hypothetical protein